MCVFGIIAWQFQLKKRGTKDIEDFNSNWRNLLAILKALEVIAFNCLLKMCVKFLMRQNFLGLNKIYIGIISHNLLWVLNFSEIFILFFTCTSIFSKLEICKLLLSSTVSALSTGRALLRSLRSSGFSDPAVSERNTT